MILECYKILKRIESRPVTHTGEAKLRSIYTYILGYYSALIENEIIQNPAKDEPFFDWVAQKLGYYESTAGWVNMILAYSIGFKPENISWKEVFATSITDEQHLKSIKFFYELVEQFKNEIEKHD